MSRRAGGRLWRALHRPSPAIVHGAAWLAMPVHAAVSLARRRRDFIRARHTGAQKLRDGGKVAVFVHHDRAGHVHDVVLRYLEALRQAGYVVVFVSNAPRLSAAAVCCLLPRVALVLHRHNVGYDFAAYKDGLAVLEPLTRFEEVVLANDSVYGPLFDLGPLLARCDPRADIWGITDSRDRHYHLQSYFLLFRRPALADPGFAAFWRSVRPVQSRLWVIRHYEIGLTRAMQRAGLRCAALFPYEAVGAAFAASARAELARPPDATAAPRRQYLADTLEALARGDRLNAMHRFWDTLVTAMHCPFIKRELLLYNPLRVPHVDRWPDVVRRVSLHDADLIEQHLQMLRRVGRPHLQGPPRPMPDHQRRNGPPGSAL